MKNHFFGRTDFQKRIYRIGTDREFSIESAWQCKRNENYERWS